MQSTFRAKTAATTGAGGGNASSAVAGETVRFISTPNNNVITTFTQKALPLSSKKAAGDSVTNNNGEDDNHSTDRRREEQTRQKKLTPPTTTTIIAHGNYGGGLNGLQVAENGQPCDKCTENCSGYRVASKAIWNNRCESCRCPPYNHRLMVRGGKPTVADLVKIQLPDWLRNLQSAVKSTYLPVEYVWAPYGLSREKIAEYMQQLPDFQRPIRGTAGEYYWHKQLIYQFPAQDFFAQCNSFLKPADLDSQQAFQEFQNTRNKLAIDRGYIIPTLDETAQCKGCKGILHKGALCVAAPKVGENAFFHPRCLTCHACQQLLPEMVYCARNESYVAPSSTSSVTNSNNNNNNGAVQHVTRIYCARHFAEKLKPRCSACDELIFSTEYTRAMNANWHVEHFACSLCSTLLTGERYVLNEHDATPICLKCYEKTYANVCYECKRPIGVVDSTGGRDLAYKDRHWHEHCFLCSVCKMSLVDKPFGTKNDRIYCGNCYDQSFGERCCKCGDVFKAGTKQLEYKGRHWHEACFACCACHKAIGTGSFVPRGDNNDIYCARCHENKFSLHCARCQSSINVGGISYKGTPYHRDCFICTHCGCTLAGQKFSMKNNDKPYCSNCYGKLFAKRCFACSQPIVSSAPGQPTKYISFEGNQWHSDCFMCDVCGSTLVGKGFITDDASQDRRGLLLICPVCAKNRFLSRSPDLRPSSPYDGSVGASSSTPSTTTHQHQTSIIKSSRGASRNA